jgi:tRNA A37 methylthiotransferase MiaB
MVGRVPPDILADRARRAIALGDELLNEYGARWTGRTVPVLVEKTGSSAFEGLSREFLRVEAKGFGEQGREVLVAVTAASDGTLSGSRVAPDFAPPSHPVPLPENLL